MHYAHIISTTVFALLLAGCPKEKPQETAPTATMPSALAPVATAAGSLASAAVALGITPIIADASIVETGHAEAGHDARTNHCPSSVSGAISKIRDIEGGVELMITAANPAGIADIRGRAQMLALAASAEADGGTGHHEGNGSGIGSGRCPVVIKRTKIKLEEVPSGAKITVIARDKKDTTWLRAESRERDKALHEPGAEGAGTKHLKNCPNAVDDVATKVKDTKEGVILTISGKPGNEAEVRVRARKLAEVSKLPASDKLAHDGAGHGGGAAGRCPVVLEGDTTVVVKDIPGGAEVTVTTKKDVAVLQKETRERLVHFTK